MASTSFLKHTNWTMISTEIPVIENRKRNPSSQFSLRNRFVALKPKTDKPC